MYYTIYKVTNQIDGKIYIGSHKTKNLNDNYMGSGKYLKYAQNKHGIEHFTKEILYIFDNAKDMYKKEAELVSEEFISTCNTYNIKVGGYGGFDYLNDKEKFYNVTHTVEHAKMMSDKVPIEIKRAASKKGLKRIGEMIDKNGGKRFWETSGFTGKTHSDETKQKMSLSAQGKHDGEKNSQFGSMWITNGTENKKIVKTDLIPKGWIRGRKMNGAVP